MSVSLARLLRESGHESVHVREASLRGQPDSAVLAFAQERNAILVTEDVGFGDLRTYPLGSHAGIILLRNARGASIRGSRPAGLGNTGRRARHWHYWLFACGRTRDCTPTSALNFPARALSGIVTFTFA